MSLRERFLEAWKKEPLLTIAASFVGAAFLLALLFLLSLGVSGVLDGLREPGIGKGLSRDFADLPVAVDDLVLPEEPDLVPAIRFFRGRKSSWSLADARPYGIRATGFDYAPLREAASAEIDAMMELVR